jgi:uncharacterized protein YndB with AHSA1/START domain
MTLTLERVSATQAVVERRFNASPELVYRAHVDPKLIQKWLLGPPGWTMPVCECDARPGGKIRYEWVNGEGHGFHLTGEFVELVPNSKLVHVERMFLPDPTPDNQVVTTFTAEGKGTFMRMTMTLPNAETLDAMLATGMTDGMEMGYQNLEKLLG